MLGAVDNRDSRFGLAVIQAPLRRSDGWVDRDRFVVSDAVWERVASLLPGKASDAGVTAKDNRLFLEAVLWRVRTGLPWRDLPQEFGNWNSVFQRFRRWVRAEVFDRMFERLSGEPDFEYALIDGTIVSAHQKASGAKGGLKIRPSAAREAG
jgi:transposase